MPVQYKVTKPCYYGDVYRTPDNKHSIVTVDKKFSKKDQPSYFELITKESVKEEVVIEEKDEEVIDEEIVDDVVGE